MERLRLLDASTTRAATVVSLMVGIVSVLLFGVGMCCTLVPGWETYFIPGILIGVLGIIGVAAAYPIYAHMVKRKREKLAPEIMRLSEELLQ